MSIHIRQMKYQTHKAVQATLLARTGSGFHVRCFGLITATRRRCHPQNHVIVQKLSFQSLVLSAHETHLAASPGTTAATNAIICTELNLSIYQLPRWVTNASVIVQDNHISLQHPLPSSTNLLCDQPQPQSWPPKSISIDFSPSSRTKR